METHEFYVVEYGSEDTDIAYEPDANWDGSAATNLSTAKRYTKLGADRKVKREKQMYAADYPIRARKVKAVYSFIEESGSAPTTSGIKILSYPAVYEKNENTGADNESDIMRSTIEE